MLQWDLGTTNELWKNLFLPLVHHLLGLFFGWFCLRSRLFNGSTKVDLDGSWWGYFQGLVVGTCEQTANRVRLPVLWYCWWFRNPANQLRLVVYTSLYIYKVLYIPGGCLGFLPSTVLNQVVFFFFLGGGVEDTKKDEWKNLDVKLISILRDIND